MDGKALTITHPRTLTREQIEGQCIIWPNAIKSNGYGVLRFAGRLQHAHRVAYVKAYGPIDATVILHHVCANRACVNPKHLRPSTKSENALLGKPGLAKQTCKRSHPLQEGNLYTSNGKRTCRQCARDRAHARYHGGTI